MELKNVLAELFPTGVANGRGGHEINGLPRGSEPHNCEVLLRGKEANARGERREFYLVRCRGTLLYLRICTAMEGSGYDEFVVIHDVATTRDEQEELQERARSRMRYLVPSS